MSGAFPAGQVAPAAATATQLFVCANALGAVMSVVVNNTNASGTAIVFVEKRIAGSAVAAAFAYTRQLAGQADTTIGPFAIGNTDEIWVTTDTTLVNFNGDRIDL